VSGADTELLVLVPVRPTFFHAESMTYNDPAEMTGERRGTTNAVQIVRAKLFQLENIVAGSHNHKAIASL